MAGISCGPALGSGAGREDSGTCLEQRLEREPDVGDDRVAHRRARGLVGVAGDRDQRRALGQQRAGDVRVVGEDRGAGDEDQVVALERLADRADRRRQHAAEVRVALGEAEPAAAGRRARPDRQALALGERDRGVPAAAGVDVGAGDEHRVGGARRAARRARATASGSATARPVTCARDRVGARRPRRPRRPSRPSGSRRTPGPCGGSDGEVGAVGERERHVLGARRLVAPLDQRVRHAGRVAVGEVGLHRDLRADLLAGGDQQRRVVGLRVEDRAHRVADAGRGVQVDERGARRRPARSRRPCRPRPPPAGRARSGSRRGSRRASAARSSRGCRTSSSSPVPGRGRSWPPGRSASAAPYLPRGEFKRARPRADTGRHDPAGQTIEPRRQGAYALRANLGRSWR